jgi:hypothetical protein
MREHAFRFARWGLALLIVAFVARTFQRNWQDLQAQPVAWTLRPLPGLGSVLLVWGMYAMLIEAWRRMLAGWGQELAPLPAARIWVLSSLGKYVPGKVWAIAGMALMAREAGVAAWAATASAIFLQALAVGTGAAMAAIAGGPALEAYRPGVLPWFWMAGALAVAGVVALLHPRVSRSVLALAGMGPEVPTPGAGPIVVGLLSNLVAWVGYGLAFWLLAAAVLPLSSLQPAAAIAAFAASYVVGLVTLIAPGGLVVREALLIALLSGSLGLGPATALAIASRVLLTITELGAAVPFLLLRRRHARAA